jgi:hypothetical protein
VSLVGERSARVVAVGGVLAAVAASAGCGGGVRDDVVARVGRVVITSKALAHWTSVLAAEYPSLSSERRLLQKRALAFLISSYWMTGGAAEDGRAVSSRAVQAQLRARMRSYAGGEREFSEALVLRGQRPADAAFEIAGELASAGLHEIALSGVQPVTPTEIVAYYEHHKGQYFESERRQVVVVESTRAATARKLKREAEQGRALEDEPGHQFLAYALGLHRIENALEKALFAAAPNVISGPVAVGHYYFVFEVTRAVRGYERPLSRVATVIKQALVQAHEHAASSAFFSRWSSEWQARTDCSPQYLIAKCGRRSI